MILRPVPPAAAHSGTVPIPAWDAIFPTQRERADRYLLVAQDDHAQLAGELAAAFRRNWLTDLDDEMVDAIRLHDCGWRSLDEKLLARAREGATPVSFLDMRVPEFLAAWTESIERVAARSAKGGAVVSLHFSRLAEYRLGVRQDTPEDARQLGAFLQSETRRRQSLGLAGDQSISDLTDALQLCDLLSLYLCCGATAAVAFPQFGGTLVLRREGEKYVVEPASLCTPLELTTTYSPWPQEDGHCCQLTFCLVHRSTTFISEVR
jgi:hypothetical protein